MYYELHNVYQEHFPTAEDLIAFLGKIPCMTNYFFILHDKDVMLTTGEIKKPHYHVVVEFTTEDHNFKNRTLNLYKSPKTFTEAVAVRSLSKMLRYLTHKDNLEKYQYSSEEVVTSDRETYEGLIVEQLKESKNEMITQEIIGTIESRLLEGTFREKDLFSICFNVYNKYRQVSYFQLHAKGILDFMREYSRQVMTF